MAANEDVQDRYQQRQELQRELNNDSASEGEGVEHFRSLQRVDELNESLENLNSARSQNRGGGGLQYTLAMPGA